MSPRVPASLTFSDRRCQGNHVQTKDRCHLESLHFPATRPTCTNFSIFRLAIASHLSNLVDTIFPNANPLSTWTEHERKTNGILESSPNRGNTFRSSKHDTLLFQFKFHLFTTNHESYLNGGGSERRRTR